MAEQIPFNVIADILVKLGTSAVQEIGSAFGVGQALTAIKPKLDILNGVLVDAEEKQVESHAVQAWLRRLKDVVYAADDLLDDFATHQLQRGGVARQVCDFFSSSNQVAFRFKMSDKVKQIKKEVDEIVNQIPPMLNLIQGNRVQEVESRWRDTHSFALASEIVGREGNKEEILKMVLSSDDEEILSMVAIVGIGGLGKTTLAQLVYNDKAVVQHFETRTWVCVSDNFDVRGLIVKILTGVHERDVERLELDGLKDLLHKKLSQKRCFLVLDDVWNENYGKWDQLKRLLMVVGRGSKILVTTRKTKVASIMGIDSPYVLEGLNEAQSWDLLSKIALKSKLDEVQPKLIMIGKEIVSMCKGVPLVIKTLGSILSSKIEESWWLSIRNNKNLLCLEAGNDDVLLVLKLSYNNLPIYLKQCFTYCALFPKGYEINKKALVQLWMAQGYVHPFDEEVGYRYFDELLSRLLLEEFRRDDSNNILSCKMHDLIHDLAQSLMRSEMLVLEENVKEIPKGVHHVSLYEPNNVKLQGLKGKHIRTLFTIGSCYGQKDYLNSNFMCLRVLSLEALHLQKIPKALGKLSHLRYLDLSYNYFEELPNSIAKLKNLQTLRLLDCYKLKKFPTNIRELINMRHWESDECLSHMPCGIGKLTLLQSLPVFVVGKGRGVGRLNELNGLHNLREELRIVELQNARDTTIGCGDANLRAKQYIQSLILEWEYTEEEEDEEEAQQAEKDESVMEGLHPPPNLKKLHISRYGGVRFPNWGLRNAGLSGVLPNLTSLKLERWSRCQTLPCLVGLPYLKSLELLYFLELKQMECSSQGPFFPSLQTLSLCQLPKLMELWRRDLPTNTPSFSCLSQLKIEHCDNLASLEVLHSSPLLCNLVIFSCPKLTSLLLPSPLLSQLKIELCNSLASLELRSSLLSMLNVSGCPMLTSLLLPPSSNLSQLKLQYCDNLASLELHSSPLLSDLYISSCTKLTSIKLPPCADLSQLVIQYCYNLASFELQLSPLLSILFILYCPKLTSLMLPPSPRLSHLEIWQCPNLASLKLPSLPSLEQLKLHGIKEWALRELILLATAASLKSVSIQSIDDLRTLPDELHHHVSSLQILKIQKCHRLATLPLWISNLASSQTYLEISNCSQLRSLPEEEHWLETSNYCSQYENVLVGRRIPKLELPAFYEDSEGER